MQILAKIRDVNDRIPDEAMTEKINQIESITREIFRAVEQEPEKRGKIDRFMSYFLPTTLKLLESYANLERTNIAGKNISQKKERDQNCCTLCTNSALRQCTVHTVKMAVNIVSTNKIGQAIRY